MSDTIEQTKQPENKCDTCRNCFADCESDPVFITEAEAATYSVPTDMVIECDCWDNDDDIIEAEENGDFDSHDGDINDDDWMAEEIEDWDEDLMDEDDLD